MSVDLQYDEASGKQGPSMHEEASDDDAGSGDDSAKNQKSGERICFFCNKNRKVYNYRALPLHSSMVKTFRNNTFETTNACENCEIESKLGALGADAIIYYHNSCRQIYI